MTTKIALCKTSFKECEVNFRAQKWASSKPSHRRGGGKLWERVRLVNAFVHRQYGGLKKSQTPWLCLWMFWRDQKVRRQRLELKVINSLSLSLSPSEKLCWLKDLWSSGWRKTSHDIWQAWIFSTKIDFSAFSICAPLKHCSNAV